MIYFSSGNLLSYTNTGIEPLSHIKDIGDVHVIYLHALQSGLLRVKMQGPIGRYITLNYTVSVHQLHSHGLNSKIKPLLLGFIVEN